MSKITPCLWLALGCVAALAPQARAQNYSRTVTYAYQDDVGKWVLGQVKRKSVDNIVAEETVYTASAQPSQRIAFGKLAQVLTYNADGTLASAKDGNHNVTTFSGWKRGIPQSIRHADGTTRSAAVNDAGWITSVKDENGFTTTYAYDAMGRVAGIAYPAGDSVAWTPVSRTLAFVTTAEYGVAANHWRETVATGNARRFVYYDALMRPVLTQVYDSANYAGTLSQTVTSYAPQGGVSFQSYPVNKGAALNVTDANLKGTRTRYDALGRPTRVEQDSELGVLVTTTAYLPRFETLVTPPRGNAALTRYMVFDQPRTDLPVVIAQPEGAITNIARDAFGKVTAIIRRNPDSSVALGRTYAYNAAQELCGSNEPETGATYMGYDGAGNLSWSASGYTAPAATCADPAVVVARRVNRTYDKRNRLSNLTFPDGRGNTTTTYTPDGLPQAVTVNNGGGNVVATRYT